MPGEGRVGAVVLAAGRSVRAGPTDKLLLSFEGVPLVRRAVDAAVESDLAPVVVVTPPGAGEVRAMLAECGVVFVENADPRAGLARSLACGVRALRGQVDAAAVLLADMPWVRAEHLRLLARAVAAELSGGGTERPGRDGGSPGRPDAWVPVFEGRRGNPVVWSSHRFDEIEALEGDRGAAQLFARGGVEAVEVAMPDDGVLRDIDTLEQWLAVARDDDRERSRTRS